MANMSRRSFIRMVTLGAAGGAGVGALTAKEGEVAEDMKHGAVAGAVLVGVGHHMLTSDEKRNADNGPDKDWRIRERERQRDERRRRGEDHPDR